MQSLIYIKIFRVFINLNFTLLVTLVILHVLSEERKSPKDHCISQHFLKTKTRLCEVGKSFQDLALLQTNKVTYEMSCGKF